MLGQKGYVKCNWADIGSKINISSLKKNWPLSKSLLRKLSKNQKLKLKSLVMKICIITIFQWSQLLIKCKLTKI